jgi:hypothetical protein
MLPASVAQEIQMGREKDNVTCPLYHKIVNF